jgi:hypothetical protein
LGIVREQILQRARPLSGSTLLELAALSGLIQSLTCFGLCRDTEMAAPRILFEDVFDAELAKFDDRLAMLLSACTPVVGHDRILPPIADRIVKIFLLRHAAFPAAEADIESFIRWMGRVNWYGLPDKLGEVFRAL